MDKYRLPWTHELAQQSTTFELLTEWWEDHFDENPNKVYEVLRGDGEFTFGPTGDPLIDKWESEIAKGLTPDLNEGLPPEHRVKAKGIEKIEDFKFEEFSDDYEIMGKGISDDFDIKDLLGRG